MVRGLGDRWSYWQRTLCCIVCKAIENQGFPHTILPKCSLVQALLTNPHNALYESGLPCLASVGCPCSGPTCTTTWQLCSSLPNQTKNTVKMKLIELRNRKNRWDLNRNAILYQSYQDCQFTASLLYLQLTQQGAFFILLCILTSLSSARPLNFHRIEEVP